MNGYGNLSAISRAWNTAVAVTWKTFISCVLGPACLYFDIASGANYFTKALEPYNSDSLNITFPTIPGPVGEVGGWHIGWSNAALMAFLLSAITTGIQVALWNFLKSGIKLSRLKPLHGVAMVAALVIFGYDVASDFGGATLWLSSATDGRLWPEAADMFQKVAIPLVVFAGIGNEAILEFFYGIDKPQKVVAKLRNIGGSKHSSDSQSGQEAA